MSDAPTPMDLDPLVVQTLSHITTRAAIEAMPAGCVAVVDDDGAVLIPQALLDEMVQAGPEQERLEAWIMEQVHHGHALPGLYPPNEANAARYAASKAG